MDFSALVSAIWKIHEHCAVQANRVVNVSLTLRNWVIGWYIREYEQQGTDRAQYGESLIEKLAETLEGQGLKDLAPRTLRQCRQFYIVYPQIRQTVSAKSFACLLPAQIWQTSSAKSLPMDEVLVPESPVGEFGLSPRMLVERLSFSHFAELISIDDPFKRAFYEIECIRGNWSVRSLKRQIATLYFERSGLSEDKEKLAEIIKAGIEPAEPRLAIRDPYVFEFLGLNAKDQVELPRIEELQRFLEAKRKELGE